MAPGARPPMFSTATRSARSAQGCGDGQPRRRRRKGVELDGCGLGWRVVRVGFSFWEGLKGKERSGWGLRSDV